ncbi:CAP domain-containing protein [Polyangium sp. 15x6]|uniref:CAP domain-containing protein n=1 Tax=Polyangium sp. 15x6 TaxID=3042687 RepID=UPI00249C832A|nr:CAP domain-containing protein [Polyangium sp. 15x6]
MRQLFPGIWGSFLLAACSGAAPPPPSPVQPAPPAPPLPSSSPGAATTPLPMQAGSTSPPAQTAPSPAAPDSSWPAESAALEQQVLDQVNARRAAPAICGGRRFGPAPALTVHPALRAAARDHSLDMASRNYFEHVTPEGRTVEQRAKATGFSVDATMGENIGAGRPTAVGAVEQWMASTHHCQNIMNPKYRHIGVGYAAREGSRYTHYWTLVFGG